MGNQGAPQHQQPPMQPPGSPTRTSCFNPQLQYGPDTVFFNMPMYGTVEGAPMYSDAMDMNNGNMSEVSFFKFIKTEAKYLSFSIKMGLNVF